MTDRPEAVSWLLLERYVLEEVTEAEQRLVEIAIRTDPATAHCHARILAENEVTLPPLSLPRPVTPSKPSVREWLGKHSWWLVPSLAAACIGIVVGTRNLETPLEPVANERDGVKGGELFITLIRERDGHTDLQPRSFSNGDRFKVQLTCAPSDSGRFAVVVVQGAEVALPFGKPPLAHCGNNVTLPGAFSLSGSLSASVCVIPAPFVASIASQTADSVRDAALVCREVNPQR